MRDRGPGVGGGGGGGRRRGRGRGRGRGGGDARDLSPNTSGITSMKIKDHHSGWRDNPFPHRPRRSLSPPMNRHGPRRSLSPLMNRPRRSPVGQSTSIERQRDYTSRRSGHSKQLHREYPRHPHSHNQPTFGNEGFEFQHEYMLPEHPIDLSSEVHPALKLSRSIKDKDLASSSGIDNQRVLLQQPMFLDDGSTRTFFSLPHDSGHPLDSAALNSSDNLRNGSVGNLNVMPRYHERLRDPYEDKEREKAYSKDVSFDSFPVIPPSQQKPFGVASSSLANGEFLEFYGDRGVGKFSDDPLEYNGYNQMQLSDPLRRGPLSLPATDEHRDYGYDGISRRGRGDLSYLDSDGLYRKMAWGPHGEFRDTMGSPLLDLAGDGVDRADASRKNLSESSFWDQHRSIHRDVAMDFRDLKGVQEDYVGSSGSGYVGFGMKSSGVHELAPFEETYGFGRDVALKAYRDRPNSPLLSDRRMDMFRQGVSPPRGKSRTDNDLGIYDLSPERTVRRKYVVSGDVNELDSRSMFSNDRNVCRRMQSPSRGDEMWSNKEGERFLPSKKPAFGHSQYRMPSHRISRNDAWAPSSDTSAHGEGGRGMSLKKRLRTGPSEFPDSFPLERRQDFFRPYKFWKRGLEDGHGGLNAPDGDVPDHDVLHVKTDPPEDSEEFKQQVHKAFLRFSKLLNESPRQQKRYRDDQGKYSNLICCVCGSLSKEFGDTHSLLTHSYHSLKVGLRTEHLGFHKALCVLMGWNWLVPPDNSKVYLSRPDAEIKALKEDLILWPPIVIIHNSSIGNKSKTNGPKVSIGGMEEILREMGFGAGKTRVCPGKPANQSVLLVKFMPTLSGLQGAQRLHKHYADNNRGRLELKQITLSNGSGENIGEAHAEKELLYGYMALAEDLDKLDPETKKRCLVKSKKDIEAIADAPLNAD